LPFLFNHLRLPSPKLDPVLDNNFLCSVTAKAKVKVTLRLTVSQSVSLDVEPHLGLMTWYLLHFDSYGVVFLGILL
jgi:hypothetical protein